MVALQRIDKRWEGTCVVAASGPSLTARVADACFGLPVVAVNDAWRMVPYAEVLYAGDAAWWLHHGGCPEFLGDVWSAHEPRANDKEEVADRFGVNLVRGANGEGLSIDPRRIHYGGNSGFQAINLACHFLGWRGTVILVGFDMRTVSGRRHFFGNHPIELNPRDTDYQRWMPNFERAAAMLPEGIRIVNATPGSALTCFPMESLTDVIAAA